jgi:hypothetical protein
MFVQNAGIKRNYKTPGEFPLIDKLPSRMTILEMLLCAGFAQLLPSYKAAETITGKHCGMKVSDTYIERVTGYAGGHIYETASPDDKTMRA